LSALLPLVLASVVAGCAPRDEAPASDIPRVRVGMVFDAGGKDDKSFNTACWTGAVRARKEFDIELKDVEPGDPSAVEAAIQTLADAGFDLIIGVGGANAPHLEDAAKQHPDLKFAVVDDAGGVLQQPNGASLVFEEHEGAFLVGMIAAAKSHTGVIGFVGGMDIPLIRRFELGYEAGAKHINPDVVVLQNYAGSTAGAWTNPNRGKELARSQYDRNADVIFAAAGTTGLGVFDAAEQENKYVIGVDANQNYLKPGHVLTSMLKRSDVAVYETIKSVVNDGFAGGRKVYSLRNDGIGYAVDDYNRDILPSGIIEQVEEAKRRIVSGELVVPDYLKENT